MNVYNDYYEHVMREDSCLEWVLCKKYVSRRSVEIRRRQQCQCVNVNVNLYSA